MFGSVYIYGLGMMGGSLAKCIKKKNISKKIYAYDIDKESLAYAKKNRIITDFDVNNFKYLSNTDLIVICTPVSSYNLIFKKLKKYKKNTAIITDIGSTKANIIRAYKQVFKNDLTSFVGSHPLTGKELSMVKNSDSEIFKKSLVLMTPVLRDNIKLEEKISKFWKKLGCQVSLIDANKHDLVLSETSHLPHIVSFALVSIILNTQSINNIEDYTGGGFKDFARLAHSDSIMWKDICSSNDKNIIKSINLLKKELDVIKKIISKKDNSLINYLKLLKTKLEKNAK